MAVSTKLFDELALEDLDGSWEIYQGELREKPSMSFAHNDIQSELVAQLNRQLPAEFRVRINSSHMRMIAGDVYVPDVAVLTEALMANFRSDRARIELYSDPLPFVVEIWSPSTSAYDVDAKIPGYQGRGDVEIWRIHPFEETVTIWRRQSDGSYVESVERSGVIALHELPAVLIDLNELFRRF